MMTKLFALVALTALCTASPTVPKRGLGQSCTFVDGKHNCDYFDCFLPSPNSTNGFCVNSVAKLDDFCIKFSGWCEYGTWCKPWPTPKGQFPSGIGECTRFEPPANGY